MVNSRQNRNVRLGPMEAIAQRVADARFEGNVSLAIRHIIREYAKSNDLPMPDAQLASAQSHCGNG